MAVLRLLFFVASREGLMLPLRPIFPQHHETHAQGDQHLCLGDLDEQVFVFHDEQYDDHDEHHQHFPSVDQCRKFG